MASDIETRVSTTRSTNRGDSFNRIRSVLKSPTPSQVPLPPSPSASPTREGKQDHENTDLNTFTILHPLKRVARRSATPQPISPKSPPLRPPRPQQSLPNIRPTVVLSPQLASQLSSRRDRPLIPKLATRALSILEIDLLPISDSNETRVKSFSEDVFSSLFYCNSLHIDGAFPEIPKEQESTVQPRSLPVINPKTRENCKSVSEQDLLKKQHPENGDLVRMLESGMLSQPSILSGSAALSISSPESTPAHIAYTSQVNSNSTSPVTSQNLTITPKTSEKSFGSTPTATFCDLESTSQSRCSTVIHKWHTRNRRVQWMILTTAFVMLVAGGITTGVVWKLSQI